MNKKAYAYFMELALAVIIVFIIISGFIESEQTVFNYKQNEDLRQNSWYILKTLDYAGAVNSTNFSAIDLYVKQSLSDTTGFDLELYNDSGCFEVNKGIWIDVNYTRCPSINASTRNDIVSSYYTRVQDGSIESIRLYLWRKI